MSTINGGHLAHTPANRQSRHTGRLPKNSSLGVEQDHCSHTYYLAQVTALRKKSRIDTFSVYFEARFTAQQQGSTDSSQAIII